MILKFYVLPTEYIAVILMDLRTNSCYFLVQHLIRFYNLAEVFTVRYGLNSTRVSSSPLKPYHGTHGYSQTSHSGGLGFDSGSFYVRIAVDRVAVGHLFPR